MNFSLAHLPTQIRRTLERLYNTERKRKDTRKKNNDKTKKKEFPGRGCDGKVAQIETKIMVKNCHKKMNFAYSIKMIILD